MALRDQILDRAQKYVLKGSLDKAIAEYKAAYDLDPRDFSIRLKIGDLYVKSGKKAEAIKEYTEAARANFQRGFYLKAIAVYKQALKLDESNVEIHYKLAELYVKQRLIADAISEYSYILSLFERKGKTSEALEIIKKMVEIDPENIGVRLKLADLYQKLSFDKDALAEYSSIFGKLLNQGKLDTAEKVYSGVFNAYPRDVSVLKDLCELYRRKGDSPQFLKYSRSLFHMYRDKGDTEAAKEVCHSIIEVRPDEHEAMEFLARFMPAPEPQAPEPAPPTQVEEEKPLIEFRFEEGEALHAVEPAREVKGKTEEPEAVESPLIDFPEEEIEITLEGVEESGEAGEEFKEKIEAAGPEALKETEDRTVACARTGDHEPSLEEVEIEIPLDMEPSGPLLEEAFQASKEGMEAAGPVDERASAVQEEEPGEIELEIEEPSVEIEAPVLPFPTMMEEEPGEIELEIEEPSVEGAEAAPEVHEEPGEIELEIEEPRLPEAEPPGEPEEAEHIEVKAEEIIIEPEAVPEIPAQPQSMTGPVSSGAAVSEPVEEGSEDDIAASIEKAIEEEIEAEQIIEAIEDINKGLEAVEEKEAEISVSEYTVNLLGDQAGAAEQASGQAELTPKEELSRAIDELMEKIEPENVLVERQSERARIEEVLEEEPLKEEYVDLSAELGMEEATQELSETWAQGQPKESVDEFRKGIGEQLNREDTETHYNLGIAYMEMGLFNEASMEFKIALKDPELEFDCYTRLGLCAMSQFHAEEAIVYYLKGLKAEGKDDEERKGIMYELALAYEMAGKKEEALHIFSSVYRMDPFYREVGKKIKSLMAVPVPAIPLDDGLIEVELF